MIKLGLISDIHGDPESLQFALDFLQHQHVDRIICAGDLIRRGPDNDGAVSMIRDSGIECVAGNHDSEWEESLSGDSIEFLARLPEKFTAQIDNLSILMVHA